MKNGIFIEPENVRYLAEGGVEQLDGDYIPEKSSVSGANYFERGSQVMHFVSVYIILLNSSFNCCCILSLRLSKVVSL